MTFSRPVSGSLIQLMITCLRSFWFPNFYVVLLGQTLLSVSVSCDILVINISVGVDHAVIF